MAKEWLIAAGLFLIFEGLMPALLPNHWKKMMSEIAEKPEGMIRLIGFISMLAGLFWVLWVVKFH